MILRLRILEAATISIALVIFCVFWTLAILLRISFAPAMSFSRRLVLRQPPDDYRGLGCFEGIEDAFQLAFDFVVIATGLVDLFASAERDHGRRKPAERLRSYRFSPVPHLRGNRVQPRTAPGPAEQQTLAHTVSASAARSLSDRGQLFTVASSGRMQTENAASSRYCASAVRIPPDSFFMILV